MEIRKEVTATEKCYDTDAYLTTICAKVLRCEEKKDCFWVELDRTVFFPQGGGQAGDCGKIGDVNVRNTMEQDGVLYHITDRACPVGSTVVCVLDFETRFVRMQNHSAEHLFSGLIYRKFGMNNVGFHLGDGFMTVDTEGKLTADQIDEVQQEANRLIVQNLPIRSYYPSKAALSTLEYRSKLDLTQHVRIVEVGNIDRCACCAPHVKATGEIGLLKVLDAIRYKGGMRLTLAAGGYALEDYYDLYRQNREIMHLLSVEKAKTADGVARLRLENETLRRERAELQNELVRALAAGVAATEDNPCLFVGQLDNQAMRRLLSSLTSAHNGICGVFSGSDEEGYTYVIGTKNVPLGARRNEIALALNARGGGGDEMLSGKANANRQHIAAYFSDLCF